jgi:putative oxidoreductase
MQRWLGRYAEILYALLRLVVGLLFACHGAQKLLGAFGAQPMTSNPQMLLAGTIELVGGVMIAVGLLTGYAAFLASGLMAFAYFMAHAPQGFWPIVNKGELAVVYCFLFLYMAARGSGPYSLDAAFRKGPRQA